MKKVKGVWKQARTIGGKVGNIGIPTWSAVRRWDLLNIGIPTLIVLCLPSWQAGDDGDTRRLNVSTAAWIPLLPPLDGLRTNNPTPRTGHPGPAQTQRSNQPASVPPETRSPEHPQVPYANQLGPVRGWEHRLQCGREAPHRAHIPD